MNKRCYNAGKISGLSYLSARAKFDKFDEEIRKAGMVPVNPMVDGLRADRPWWMHMVYDALLLVGCSHVLFQPDWFQSKGARIEFKLARFFRKKIIYG